MKGLGSTICVEGEGLIKWVFRDNYGVNRKVKIKAPYVPTSLVRLFSL